MLVLSRHRNEVVVLGDEIAITIVDIRGDKVRIGIDAPKAVPVHRLEVYEAICKNTGAVNKFANMNMRTRKSGLLVPENRSIQHTPLKGGTEK